MTDEAKALVERLRRWEATNQLSDQAAAYIETQAREIERLREALRALLLYATPNTLGSLPAFTRAHAALKGDSHDQ